MERFIFVAAITLAVIFGVVAVFGHGFRGMHGVHIDIGEDTDPIMPAAPGRLAAERFTGDRLEIRHAAAHVTIVPEDRQDFSIEITNPGRVPMPSVSADDDHVIIDGHLGSRIGNCGDQGVQTRGYGSVTNAQMPQIVVHAPRTLHVEDSSAGLAEIGPTQSLDLDLTGCGSATAGDVAGELKVNLRGSGQIHAAAAHTIDADITGSGSVIAGAVADGADISVLGSGSVTLGSLNGALNTNSRGSGDINVSAGAITSADLDVLGSGGVSIAAPVQTLKASIRGSGDVNVTAAVHDVDASIAGSGSVHATSITGALHKQTAGSGDVTTGP
jgi:hypothetical protein